VLARVNAQLFGQLDKEADVILYQTDIENVPFEYLLVDEVIERLDQVTFELVSNQVQKRRKCRVGQKFVYVLSED
jgi:hypothetical protein